MSWKYDEYSVEAGDYFAFYGLLMDDLHTRGDHGEYSGDCLIPGNIYSVNDGFPALVLPQPNDATSGVKGRLWKVPDDGDERANATFGFDLMESFHYYSPETSMYVRKKVRLLRPDLDAWVYEWNYGTAGYDLVPGGDWATYKERYAVEVISDWFKVPVDVVDTDVEYYCSTECAKAGGCLHDETGNNCPMLEAA